MKILFTNFHNTNGGGHVTYILDLARELSGQHDVSLAVSPTSRLYRYARELADVRVIEQRYSSRLLRMIPEVRQLRRLLRANRYDVVHVNGSADHRHVMLACQGLSHRPKVVWTKHNDHSITSFGNVLRARLATDHVISVSSFVKSMVDNSPYAALPQTVIRHGIDTRRFSPADASDRNAQRRALFGDDHHDLIVFGSTGGTDYDKGWLDLLAAVSKLPAHQRGRVRVVVAGAPLSAEKQRRVDDLGVADLAVFPGLVDDVRPLLAACDTGFVLSYREALSYACREAMAMGLPALVSSAGGLPENVSHGHDGWIVPPKAPEAILPVLTTIMQCPQVLAEMGRAARQKSETEFAMAPFVAQTFAVYQAVMRS